MFPAVAACGGLVKTLYVITKVYILSKKFDISAVDFSRHPEMIQMDGKNLFSLRYECKHAKLHNAYDSIKRSLDYCLRNIDYINSHRRKTSEPFVNENISAHSTSMITHYGRCFASGRAKLEKHNVPKEYLKTHDNLMSLRNEYIAHSGGNGEVSMNLIALYPNSKNKKIMYISAPMMVRINFINEPFLLEIKKIVLHLYSFVESKLKIHYEKICDEIRSQDIDDLYAKFDEFVLTDLEYSPSFTPGDYEFRVDIKPDGLVFIKGNRK